MAGNTMVSLFPLLFILPAIFSLLVCYQICEIDFQDHEKQKKKNFKNWGSKLKILNLFKEASLGT